jgi:uncharacterized protein YjbJ (UPF0337 family)
MQARTKSARSLHQNLKGVIMNKDQVKGKAKEIGGKIQEEAGELVGSSKQQAKGLANQVEGKMQKKVGDAREAVDDAATIRRGNRQ